MSVIYPNGSITQYEYNGDGLGSVVALTDSAGAKVSTYDYDEFGLLTANQSQPWNNYKFTSATYDSSPGLYLMGARYYNPNTGRFITQDTWAGRPCLPWTQHLYTYVGNNPLKYVDPTGHSPDLLKEALDFLVAGAAKVVFAGSVVFSSAIELLKTTLHVPSEYAVELVISALAPGVGQVLSVAKNLLNRSEGKAVSVAERAAAAQKASGYNADEWAETTLTKGTIICGGLPGQSSFYTTPGEISRGGLDHEVLWGNLQVRQHRTKGYRTKVGYYEVTRDITVAVGKSLVNPIEPWPGGWRQYYVPEQSWSSLHLIRREVLH